VYIPPPFWFHWYQRSINQQKNIKKTVEYLDYSAIPCPENPEMKREPHTDLRFKTEALPPNFFIPGEAGGAYTDLLCARIEKIAKINDNRACCKTEALQQAQYIAKTKKYL
jgi:hypothetical protein